MSSALQSLLVAVFAVLAAARACPTTVPVRCPVVQVVQDFQVGEYLGRWYEIERAPQVFQPNGACVTAQYGIQDNPVYPVSVVNRQFNEGTGVYDRLAGGVKVADDAEGGGKLKVIFPLTEESDYWVLATDYVNFALVYSCRQITPDTIYESAWVLGRQPQLTLDTKRVVDVAFQNSGVSRDILTKTRQDSACRYDVEPR